MIKTNQLSLCSCVPSAKKEQYLDPHAKLIYDLRKEMHYLSRQNRHLRTTMITAPNWELHALAHTSDKAISQELEDERALRAMHKAILMANTTYEFKARFGGRMYFPSPVAGREIPIKPTKRFNADEALRSGLCSGAHLENSSMTSAGIITGSEAEMEEDNNNSRFLSGGGAGSKSQTLHGITKELSEASLTNQLRRRGANAIAFRKSRKDDEIKPIRDTTRLGFSRGENDWQLLDWPKELRRRVAAMEESKSAEDAATAGVAAHGWADQEEDVLQQGAEQTGRKWTESEILEHIYIFN